MAGRRLRKAGTSSSGSGNGRRTIEQRAIKVLLCMAWAWIVGFCLVVGWYLNKPRANQLSRKNILESIRRLPMLPTSNKQNILPQVSGVGNAGGGGRKYESPLLIFTCNRANYLADTLKDIFDYIPRTCQIGCPIVISQDGTNQKVAEVIRDYQQKFNTEGIPLVHIQHKQSLRGPVTSNKAYEALAKHYKWALTELLNGKVSPTMPIPQRVIILEEDLHIAPDFFSYFQATSQLLDDDRTLIAVSAFNDNGHVVYDPKRLLRSDFFPGLGWMMTRSLWIEELQSKWPDGYWDDWLRDPAQRQGRQVIRPEISRTYHFGTKGGASNNQFGTILSDVKLNKENVDWMSEDLSYLENTAYNAQYGKLVQASRQVSSLDEALNTIQTENVRLEYQNYEDFRRLANRVHIMDDEKAMVPRTAYKGIVETRPTTNNDGHHILFLTPPIQQLREDFPAFAN